MNWLRLNNREGFTPLSAIPVVDYSEFSDDVRALLRRPEFHVVHYFAVASEDGYDFYLLAADDATGEVLVACHRQAELHSMVAEFAAMHPFEREISELYGLHFEGSPWEKPLRYPAARADKDSNLDNYPFYHIRGEALHEVNVGPIHAGVIEPGVFRFICNGERILHLEIALGYQHRGVEPLFCSTDNALRRICLAESIAGDSAVAHSVAHAMVMERLAGVEVSEPLEVQRAVALELERIAIHLADIGALCGDVAYQLGQVACEALRTIVINTTQRICGNRFGKGLIRPAGSHFDCDSALCAEISANMEEVSRRFAEVLDDLKNTPSVLARFEECGILSGQQARAIGAVGVTARASGLPRDVRSSHPWGWYARELEHNPEVREFGDVMSRMTVRGREILQSARYVVQLVGHKIDVPAPDYGLKPAAHGLAFAMVEGWRGEVCHVALTDASGRLAAYKIKDPSLHNWLGLTLAVRGAGISDFPVCNKSFNLSYCGHDL